jgi:hypothetical protein
VEELEVEGRIVLKWLLVGSEVDSNLPGFFFSAWIPVGPVGPASHGPAKG